MEIKCSVVMAILATCLMFVQAFALPMSEEKEAEENLLSADKRPKYMDTRDLSYFKDLLLFALDELIEEGKISPSVLVAPAEAGNSAPSKRGRHLGICVSLSPSGSYRPHPCWKREGRRR